MFCIRPGGEAIFPLEDDKNYPDVTPKDVLSQTWRRLLASRLQKSLQKREKAPQESNQRPFGLSRVSQKEIKIYFTK